LARSGGSNGELVHPRALLHYLAADPPGKPGLGGAAAYERCGYHDLCTWLWDLGA